MRKYSQVELANVQNYLMLRGHACPSIAGEDVHYLDRTPGFHRVMRKAKIDSILEEIRTLKKIDIDHYDAKSQYVAGSNRLGIGMYQVFEYRYKLLYLEDVKIEHRKHYQRIEIKDEQVPPDPS